MKLLRIKVLNFGSYSELDLDLTELGLTLIHGDTGAGKSTIQDMVCWTLLGITAKGGSVDDIRNWNNKDEETIGELTLQDKDGIVLTITRIRGATTQNDLFWYSDHTKPHRGTNIKDTQKLLEQKLGISGNLYMLGAYFNEFSPSASFFTDSANKRRELLEQIANFEWVTNLSERVSIAKKETRKSHVGVSTEYNQERGRIDGLRESEAKLKRASEEWSAKKEERIKELEEKITTIKQDESRLYKTKENLENSAINNEERCSKCGNPDKKIIRMLNDIKSLEYTIQSFESKRRDIVTQIKKLNTEGENPYSSLYKEACSANEVSLSKYEHLKFQFVTLGKKLNALHTLSDLTISARSLMLKNAVQQVQDKTNEYLEKYFDSRIRVSFLADKDSLNISIQKEGHECVYTQLSKGERGLLKLCFSVSIMKAVSNNSGVHFSSLFFDESMDGLDSDLKIKAFSLFSELETEHDSVLVIEHSNELKSLFNNKIHVSMIEDESRIEHE